MADTGRAPSGQATRAPHEAPAGLDHSASILRALIERCESAKRGSEELDEDIEAALGIDWATDCSTSIDGALELLPTGADWRRLSGHPKGSMSVYAANPYNTAAQRRHDGYGATPALQLCSAALKIRLEPILKALATEARRAATPQSDAVHEGAGRDSGNAQTSLSPAPLNETKEERS